VLFFFPFPETAVVGEATKSREAGHHPYRSDARQGNSKENARGQDGKEATQALQSRILQDGKLAQDVV